MRGPEMAAWQPGATQSAMRGDSSSVRGVGGSTMAQQEKEFTPNPKISVPHLEPTRWEERRNSCRLSASTVMCVHA